MCRIESIFLLQRLKRSMSGDARNFNNIETRAVIKFFSLQGNAPKEIHAILKETLGEHAPSYGTVKNWYIGLILCSRNVNGNPITGQQNSARGNTRGCKLSLSLAFFLVPALAIRGTLLPRHHTSRCGRLLQDCLTMTAVRKIKLV